MSGEVEVVAVVAKVVVKLHCTRQFSVFGDSEKKLGKVYFIFSIVFPSVFTKNTFLFHPPFLLLGNLSKFWWKKRQHKTKFED